MEDTYITEDHYREQNDADDCHTVMTRVFPLTEWATDEGSLRNSASPSQESRGSPILSRYRRQRSVPLLGDPALSEELRSMSLTSGNASNSESPVEGGRREGGKREGGIIRGLLRKASVTLKSKGQRRHSHTVDDNDRPSTASSAWRTLRGAASFNRTSRFLEPVFDSEGPVDSCEELLSPIPGSGAAPPIIPHGSGSAARRTAAAQNEIFGRHRHFLSAEDQLGDRESGIGIALTTNDAPTYQDNSDTSISRVDFISRLPVELAIQILAHLDHTGLCKTIRVSKSWAQVARSQHVWREAFLREKSRTYAMSHPVKPGSGLGLPDITPEKDWKDLYRTRQQLEHNWRDGKAEPVYLNGHLDSIYCVQFDESKIITGSRDKTIRIWDMRTYKCTLVIGPPHVLANLSLMTGDDGKTQHYAMMPDQSRQSECIPKSVSFDIHHNQSILCLQYDDSILVTGSSDGTCIVYDIKNDYQPIRRLQHHTAAVLDLAFDERYIVTCSKDVSICVWDRATGVMLKQLRGHSGPVNAVQMRGNTIVSCSGDFRVKLWNIDTGKNIREFSGHTKGLACSQFSSDSRFIASAGNDKIIRIWDANTGECLQHIKAHENLVRSLHIDSVSGRLVSGSYDHDIKVFEMETGRLLLDFPKWHASWVLGAKSDYRRIISTGQDPKILIMDFGLNIEGIEKLESSSYAAPSAT